MNVLEKKHKCLLTEIIALFVFCPAVLGLPIPIAVKLCTVGLTILYGLICAYKIGVFTDNSRQPLTRSYLTLIVLRFFIFALLSCCGMWLYAPEKLFYVVIYHTKLWVTMSLVYTFLSVVPQEFFYRTFFFKRYYPWLHSHYGYSAFLFTNAALFCFAHFFLHNTLVYILTFCGGVIFNLSYKKHQSLWLVSAEHSAYGLWLFTIGMGDMLAFPGSPT